MYVIFGSINLNLIMIIMSLSIPAIFLIYLSFQIKNKDKAISEYKKQLNELNDIRNKENVRREKRNKKLEEYKSAGIYLDDYKNIVVDGTFIMHYDVQVINGISFYHILAKGAHIGYHDFSSIYILPTSLYKNDKKLSENKGPLSLPMSKNPLIVLRNINECIEYGNSESPETYKEKYFNDEQLNRFKQIIQLLYLSSVNTIKHHSIIEKTRRPGELYLLNNKVAIRAFDTIVLFGQVFLWISMNYHTETSGDVSHSGIERVHINYYMKIEDLYSTTPTICIHDADPLLLNPNQLDANELDLYWNLIIEDEHTTILIKAFRILFNSNQQLGILENTD